MFGPNNAPRLAGQSNQSELREAVPATPSVRMMWLEEECKFLRRENTNLADEMRRVWTRQLIVAIIVCAALIGVFRSQQSKLEERIRVEHGAFVAASTAAIAEDKDHEGWRIVEMWDDLRVVHVRWDHDLEAKVTGWQHAINASYPDAYIHLDSAAYEYVKSLGRDYIDWSYRAPRDTYEHAAQGPECFLEDTTRFEGERMYSLTNDGCVIGVLHVPVDCPEEEPRFVYLRLSPEDYWFFVKRVEEMNDWTYRPWAAWDARKTSASTGVSESKK